MSKRTCPIIFFKPFVFVGLAHNAFDVPVWCGQKGLASNALSTEQVTAVAKEMIDDMQRAAPRRPIHVLREGFNVATLIAYCRILQMHASDLLRGEGTAFVL